MTTFENSDTSGEIVFTRFSPDFLKQDHKSFQGNSHSNFTILENGVVAADLGTDLVIFSSTFGVLGCKTFRNFRSAPDLQNAPTRPYLSSTSRWGDQLTRISSPFRGEPEGLFSVGNRLLLTDFNGRVYHLKMKP